VQAATVAIHGEKGVKPGTAAAQRGWARACACLLPAVAFVASAKTPVVKWGQKPDKLYLTMPLPDMPDPEVSIEDKRIYFKSVSRGEEYEIDIDLLRGINTTDSKYTIDKWKITFDLKKIRREPCWNRLTKNKKKHAWLKKDQDKWYISECQHAKELWREAYFRRKLGSELPGGEDAQEEVSMAKQMEDAAIEQLNQGKKEMLEEKEKKKGMESMIEDQKKQEQEQWTKTLEKFRSRAVPRTSKAKRKRRRKHTEL